MTKLKPCPFCGGEAELIRKSVGYDSEFNSLNHDFVAKCRNCNFATPYFSSRIVQLPNGEVKVYANGAEDAINAWNRRVRD